MSSYNSAAIANTNSMISPNKIAIYTGLALFAMFFGAGNIVFPLYLGANCGSHILVTVLGFLLGGVGVPFLGLVAISLYHGDYFAFFARLGKVPALIMISIVMIALGPLGAMPRTETTTFNTLLPYLPEFLKNNTVFSVFYCSLALCLAYRENKIVKILGTFLSPVKIISFSCLVLLGLLYANSSTTETIKSMPTEVAFQQSVLLGYNTMDLLAGIFFCAIAFRSIQLATKENTNLNPSLLTLKSCALGAVMISLVYTGFILLAYNHTSSLQGLRAEQTISVISNVVLGKFGGLFVCITVSFACLATTVALAQACSQCLYQDILKGFFPKQGCLILIIIITYLTSNLGFQGISELISPIVKIIYPALIVHCVLSILHQWKGIKIIKLPVFLTMLVSFWFTTYNF